jgi:hypothetical protein
MKPSLLNSFRGFPGLYYIEWGSRMGLQPVGIPTFKTGQLTWVKCPFEFGIPARAGDVLKAGIQSQIWAGSAYTIPGIPLHFSLILLLTLGVIC